MYIYSRTLWNIKRRKKNQKVKEFLLGYKIPKASQLL